VAYQKEEEKTSHLQDGHNILPMVYHTTYDLGEGIIVVTIAATNDGGMRPLPNRREAAKNESCIKRVCLAGVFHDNSSINTITFVATNKIFTKIT
jgi:hypothetical protein